MPEELAIPDSTIITSADVLPHADHLINGYWQAQGGNYRRFDHTNITVNITDLPAADQELAIAALDQWALISTLTFTYTTGAADIMFDSTGPDAVPVAENHSVVSGNTLVSSTVHVSTNWNPGVGADFGSYRYLTYLHEIGHALGLGHLGNYNGGNPTYPEGVVVANDSYQVSVMSYYSQSENPYVHADHAYPVTPQLADLQAIYNLYGLGTVNPTDTVYSVGNNTGMEAFDADSFRYNAVTILDDGGNDTIDVSDTSFTNYLDLSNGAVSDLYGREGNLVLAFNTRIENAKLGNGNDTVIANSSINAIYLNGGNDILYTGNTGMQAGDFFDGGDGIDTLIMWEVDTRDFTISKFGFVSVGTSGIGYAFGFENFYLGPGDDTIEVIGTTRHVDAGSGNNYFDILNPITANQTFIAGGGVDTLDLSHLQVIAVVGDDGVFYPGYDLDYRTGLLHDQRQQITITAAGFESVVGSSGDDNFTGYTSADTLFGNDGNDTLDGGEGVDQMFGGAGNDVIFWDANDELANVLGGDDHDILVFTSGDAPTSFNLASHEFEAAEGRVTDTDNAQSWAGYTDFYTVDWLRDVQTGTNDSGSTWLTDFDQNSEYDWSEVTLYYDTFGDTDVYVGHRDDGSGWVVDYDLEDTQGWFSAGYYYDHLGRDDSSLGTYDDGRSWLIDYDQDDTQGWSLTRNIFTESGATDLFAGDYDDGRSWLIDYDQDSVEGWSYVQIFFDTAGATDIYTGLWDDGRYWHYDMDQNDEHDWAEDSYLFDDSGNLLSHWQIMDDGSTVYV